MLRKLFFSNRFMFGKLITPQNYSQVRSQFLKNPQTQGFGEYYSSQNAMPIFSIIKQATRLQKTERLMLLNDLQALCQKDQSNTDQNLNMLANIHWQKANQLQTMGSIDLFIKQVQAAIAVIQVMENPDQFFLGQLHRSEGQGYYKKKQYSKAQNCFHKGQNYLKNCLQDVEQSQKQQSSLSQQAKIQLFIKASNAKVGISRLYSQMALSYMSQQRITEAKQANNKSVDYWEKLHEYKGIPYFQFTMRLKCLLLILTNQQNQALYQANKFLEFLTDENQKTMFRENQKDIPILWFGNFYIVSSAKNSEGEIQENRNKWLKWMTNRLKHLKQIAPQPVFKKLILSTGIKLQMYGMAQKN